MKVVRDYLTSNEIMEIVDALVQEESAIAREIVKIGMVCQCVCDELGDFKDCNEIYDSYMEEAFDLELDIKNYYTIDECVNKELSIDKSMRILTKILSDKVKDINIEDLTQQIANMKEVVK